MAASFNKVIILGNITRDIQVKYTTGGTAVAEIGLAVNRDWFDKASNSKKSECTFVDVTLFGRTAEIAAEFLAKGRPVLIEGRLSLDTWQDKESGQKRSKLKVIGESMTMLGSGGQQGGGERQQQRDEPKPHQEAPNSFDDPVYNPGQVDDVPF